MHTDHVGLQDLTSLVAVLEPIIRQAGDTILMQHFSARDRLTWHLKSDGSYVTTADHEVDAFLREHLTQLFPDSAILCEESALTGVTTSSTRWIVDPLDGTTNFLHGIPYFGITIALEQEGTITFGMTYNPITTELWHACRGQGAYRNGVRITLDGPLPTANDSPNLQDPHRLGHRPFALALPTATASLLGNAVQTAASSSGSSVRRFGAIALDFAYVAQGSLAGVLYGNLLPWDAAAGELLVAEAGGTLATHPVTTADGPVTLSSAYGSRFLPFLQAFCQERATYSLAEPAR